MRFFHTKLTKRTENLFFLKKNPVNIKKTTVLIAQNSESKHQNTVA